MDEGRLLESALLAIGVYASPECRRVATREQLAERLDEIYRLADRVLLEVHPADDPIVVSA